MPFNLNEFRSEISKPKFDGLAQANKFWVEITPPAKLKPFLGDIDGRELAFFCDGGALPGKNLKTLDYKSQGYGDMQRMPIGRDSETLSLSFMCDSNYKVLKFFQNWVDYIIENTNMPTDGYLTDTGRGHREIAYMEDYAAQINVYGFNDRGNKGAGIHYEVIKAYPIQIGQVQMGWEQNSTLIKIPIEFAYKSYTTSLLDRPADARTSHEQGLFVRLAELGTIAGLINSVRKVKNIQDIINVVTNARLLL